jgi:DNA-binding response OmpR family regulator
MRQRILLIEDEPGLVMTLKDRLYDEGYVVTSSSHGVAGEDLAREQDFDLLILDIMLPGRNGFEICQRLRRAGVQTPILMLTARGEVSDRVRGLRLGADDYLGKPFEMSELLARVDALLRRIPALAQVLRFGIAEVDFGSGRATRKGEAIELSAQLLRLLQYLAAHAGRTVSRDHLLRAVWGHQAALVTRTVDVHIARLRSALEADPREPRHIITVRGQGYRFDP